MKTIRIQLTESPIGGQDEITVFAEDNRPMYNLRVLDDGTLEVQSGMIVKHNGIVLDENITITPKDSRTVTIKRIEYK